MGLVLLDTSFVIALALPSDAHHVRAISTFDPLQRYVISAITATEFMSGVRSARNEERSWLALSTMVSEIISVGEREARAAARIRANGRLKTPDAIISATAQLHQATLWTFDAKLAKVTPGARLIA